MKGSILFLDLGTKTGWAEGKPGEHAVCGSITLGPGGHPGKVGTGYRNFLIPRLQAFRPSLIVYESPFISGIKNANTTLITWGLAFATEDYANWAGIRCMKANLGTIRKTMMGHSPTGDGVKQAVINFVSRLGYAPQDDNAADALLGWLYACSIADPKAGVSTTPLFANS